MNNIQIISNCDKYKKIYEFPIEENCYINVIPKDILKEIFSYLADHRGVSGNRVCNYWNSFSLTQLKSNLSAITNLKNFCALNSKIPSVVQDFLNIDTQIIQQDEDGNIVPLDLVSLEKAKSSVKDVKEALINQLKLMSDPDLLQLQPLVTDTIHATFLENIFSLSRIYKELDEVFVKDDAMSKTYGFPRISTDLFRLNEMDKVLEVLKIMEKYKFTSTKCAYAFCKILTYNGNTELALKLAKISCSEKSNDRDQVFLGMAQALSDIGNNSKSLELGNTMFDKRLKGSVYGGNAVSYIKRNELVLGFDILKMTHEDTSESKAYALFPLSQHYVEINDLEKSIDLIDSITRMISLETDYYSEESLSKIRDELILYTATNLQKAGKKEQAYQIAEMTQNEVTRSNMIQHLKNVEIGCSIM